MSVRPRRWGFSTIRGPINDDNLTDVSVDQEINNVEIESDNEGYYGVVSVPTCVQRRYFGYTK